jgi:uncharacterized protein YjbI with pentapeptide repeats
MACVLGWSKAPPIQFSISRIQKVLRPLILVLTILFTHSLPAGDVVQGLFVRQDQGATLLGECTPDLADRQAMTAAIFNEGFRAAKKASAGSFARVKPGRTRLRARESKFEVDRNTHGLAVTNSILFQFECEFVGDFDADGNASVPICIVVTVRNSETGIVDTMESRPMVRFSRWQVADGQALWAKLGVGQSLPGVPGEYVYFGTVVLMDAGCSPVLLAERAEKLSVPEAMTTVEFERRLTNELKREGAAPINDIVRIGLSGMRVDAALLRMLAQHRGIDSLDLSKRPLDNETLAQLRLFSELKELSLLSTRLSKESMAAVAACPSLESLNLSRSELSREAIAALVEHGRSIRRLNLYNCGIDTMDLPLLAGMTGLVDLDLCETGIRDADAAWLSSLTNLRHLRLARTRFTSEGLGRLRLEHLESLDLSGTKIGDQDLDNVVLRMQGLRHVGVASTGVTVEGLLRMLPGTGVSRLTLDATQQERLRSMNAVNWEIWTSE